MNRLGIEMLTLLGMPPVEHVRLAGELGCVSISTGLTGLPLTMFGITDFAPYPAWSLESDPALRREMKAAMADSGVHIGLGEGFRVRSDGDVRDRAAGLDIMANLGALRINAVSMEPDMSRTHDQLALLADMVIERGMTFIVEFAPTNAIDTLAKALTAIDHVGTDRCQVMFDSMHFFRSGGTLAEIAALDPARIGYAQIADAPLVSRHATYMEEAMFARQVPGTGELPLREWIAALPPHCEIGIEVPILADMRAGMTPHDHAARLVKAARALGV